MRKVFLLMNVSLDGYFEGPDHDISWATSDFAAFSNGESATVDTLLFGHRTYEGMKAFWPTPQAREQLPEVTKFMNDTPKVVVSHNAFDPEWDNVTVISDDVMGAIRKLKEGPGGTIAVFGSNNLVVGMMQEGLIDEFQILLNPVAIGAGTSLFTGLPERAKLHLRETRKFDSGVVMLFYEPALS